MTEQGGWAAASIRRNLIGGAALVALLLGVVGGWAATTQLSGAVIASGSVVVESSTKKVQHPTGGVVGEILVREGDSVTAGQIVLRLDVTVTRANLAIVTKALTELAARKVRLEAERDGKEQLAFPAELESRAGSSDVVQTLNGERRLFVSRRTARLGQKSQLQQRIIQLNEEIAGQIVQQDAKTQELSLIERELVGVRELWSKNLTPLTRLNSLERERTRIEGERGALVAATAQSRGKIAEIELQILSIDEMLISEVSKDLREIDGKVGELVERKIAAEDQLSKTDLRAPYDGFVHQLAAHTVGGVIVAGEIVMLIVPAKEALAIEARVGPQEIDQLHVGQSAGLRFTAFNQRTTPEINGTLSRISADVSSDQRTGATFYTVQITVSSAQIDRLGAIRLVPGMPVEAFIKTGERSALSYLVKPLADQIARAFRES